MKRCLFTVGLIVLSSAAVRCDEVHFKKWQFASEALRASIAVVSSSFESGAPCLAQSQAPILAPTNPHVSSPSRGVWALNCTSKHRTALDVKAHRHTTLNCWTSSNHQQCYFFQKPNLPLPFIGSFKAIQSPVCLTVLKIS